jgi:hypothetical protein
VRNINKPDVRNKTLDVTGKTTCEEGRKTEDVQKKKNNQMQGRKAYQRMGEERERKSMKRDALVCDTWK